MSQGLALESGEFIPAEELNKMMNAKSKCAPGVKVGEVEFPRPIGAHVQNPAEIEHVAGDVSKNGAESNMMDLIDAYAEARHVGGCHTYNAKTAEARAKVVAALRTQQPAPAGATSSNCAHEWDGMVRTSMPPRYACKHCHHFFDSPPTPQPAPAGSLVSGA